MTRTPTPPVDAALRAGLEFNMLQQADELVAFVEWLEQIGVRLGTVLEIGSHQGGSSAFFCSLADRVVSVDLPDGIGGGLPITRAYQRNTALRTRFPHFTGILGDSHELDTLVEVRSVLDGQPVDLLFIDGDHSVMGVASDYAMYGEFVRPGGVIAFHDIVPTTDPRSVGVAEFWSTVRGPKVTFSADASWGGIGAIQCLTPRPA